MGFRQVFFTALEAVQGISGCQKPSGDAKMAFLSGGTNLPTECSCGRPPALTAGLFALCQDRLTAFL